MRYLWVINCKVRKISTIERIYTYGVYIIEVARRGARFTVAGCAPPWVIAKVDLLSLSALLSIYKCTYIYPLYLSQTHRSTTHISLQYVHFSERRSEGVKD